MALLGALTTWSAGDKLTATALNNEFLNLLDALNGSDLDNVKIEYGAADLPTLQLGNTHGSGYSLQAGDGTDDDFIGFKSNGQIESTVAIGTAPFVITSTTEVANLNAEKCGGIAGSVFLRNDTSGQEINASSTTLGIFGDGALESAFLFWGSNTSSNDYWYAGIDGASQGYKIGFLDQGATFSGRYLTFSASAGPILNTVWGDATLNCTEQNQTFYMAAGDNWVHNYTPTTYEVTRSSVPLISFDAAGLEVAIPENATLKLEGNNAATIQVLTDGAVAWDCDAGSAASLLLEENSTLANLTNPNVGATYQLIVKQDGTGSRTLDFGTYYKFSGGVAPTISTDPNDVDIVTIFVESTTIFYVTAVQNMS